jgi:hypothetical protein
MNPRKRITCIWPKFVPAHVLRLLFVLMLASAMTVGQNLASETWTNAETCGESGAHSAPVIVREGGPEVDYSISPRDVDETGFPDFLPCADEIIPEPASFVAMARFARSGVPRQDTKTYRPPNRGPPIQKAETKMIPMASLPFKERTGAILPATWSFPWV